MRYPEVRAHLAERGMLPGTTVSEKLGERLKEYASTKGKAHMESQVLEKIEIHCNGLYCLHVSIAKICILVLQVHNESHYLF
jgi:hypothetical protein